jgi:hypothetical protein
LATYLIIPSTPSFTAQPPQSPDKESEIRKEREALDGNPHRRSEDADGTREEGIWERRVPQRKPSAVESGSDDSAAAEEEDEEGRWCMSAPAGGRPSRTRRLRSARGSQIRGHSQRRIRIRGWEEDRFESLSL